ncbi:MAG: FAD-dependent oxidoreductase [bacterium]|nr:FAD-dependent oxidoreductase [bacterium]
MTIGILGGGLTGLALARFLGAGCEVLEEEAACGGLCRTVRKGPYSYDLGGHIIFSRDREILDCMNGLLGDDAVRYRRNNRIWFKGRLVKYPFENDLAALPKEDVFECLYHFLTRNYPPPANFRDWCYHRFGKGIAERYLIPYNEKIWNIPAERLGLEWVEGRIPDPPLEDVLKSAIGIETEGYTHQLHFTYPRRGGIEALVRAIEARAGAVEKGFSVRSVAGGPGDWVVSDGTRERRYERLVSTIPLPRLVEALDGVPAAVARAAGRLRHNSLICVMVAVAPARRSEMFAVYFPQRELRFHRVCFYDYFGDSCAPPGHAPLVAEITANPGDGTYEAGDGELVAHVVEGLEREGFIRGSDVRETDVARREYAYVVNDLAYGESLAAVADHCRGRGITLCGRFSEWRYLNMDACIRSALETARRLAGGEGG